MASQFDPPFCAEIGQLNDVAAGVNRTHDRCNTRDMVGRHTHQGCVLFRCAGKFHRTEYVADQMLVTQNGGLGFSRGTTGEQQHRHLIWVHRPFTIHRRGVLLGVQKRVRGHRVHVIECTKGIHPIIGCHQIRRRDPFE